MRLIRLVLYAFLSIAFAASAHARQGTVPVSISDAAEHLIKTVAPIYPPLAKQVRIQDARCRGRDFLDAPAEGVVFEGELWEKMLRLGVPQRTQDSHLSYNSNNSSLSSGEVLRSSNVV